jgi:lysophospholipase L1-like esterase
MTDIAASSRTKRTIVAVYYLILALIFLGAIEVGFRILEHFGPRSFVFRQFDSFLGVSLMPNSSGVHRHCFDGYVSTNQFGMRDAARQIEKPAGVVRVGLFGDSIVEGVHVYPTQVANRRLEARLNREVCAGKCEVLNFGVGGYGTLQEWRRYQRDGKQFNLDIVALLFTGNDVSNNLPKASSFDQNLYATPYLEVGPDGSETVQEPKQPALYGPLLFLNEKSTAFRFLYRVYFHTLYPLLVTQDPTPRLALASGFATPVDLFTTDSPRGRLGWSTTERLLDHFATEVRSAGSDFVIFYSGYELPHPTDAEIAAANGYQESTGTPVDLELGARWFGRYSQRTGVPVFDWGLYADDYAASRNLGDVGLGYSCDAHLNPEGHAVLANYMFEKLAPMVRAKLGN